MNHKCVHHAPCNLVTRPLPSPYIIHIADAEVLDDMTFEMWVYNATKGSRG